MIAKETIAELGEETIADLGYIILYAKEIVDHDRLSKQFCARRIRELAEKVERTLDRMS